MKKLMLKFGSTIASFALAFGVMASSATCSWYFHQAKVPEGMEKFRKR